MDLYRENILDHYRNPRNFGTMNNPDKTAEESNPLCGDQISMQLKIKSDDSIEEIKFSGEGCAICIASASMLTEKVKNMKFTDIKKLHTQDILSMLGVELTPSRLKCALLSLEVLHKTLS